MRSMKNGSANSLPQAAKTLHVFSSLTWNSLYGTIYPILTKSQRENQDVTLDSMASGK